MLDFDVTIVLHYQPNGPGVGTICPPFSRWLSIHEKRSILVQSFLTFPTSL